jgi:protein-S-isoprenylcysteine O-methyltransferase Ste14
MHGKTGDPIVKNCIFNTIFLIGMIMSSIIRAPYARRKKNIVESREMFLDQMLLLIVFVGMFIIPVAYMMTNWFGFANYQIPMWAGGLGIAMLAVSLWLFWRAHADLGENWLLFLQIKKDHTLITEGVFHYIRHPMYASLWLWCIAQTLLLQNWIAGWSGILGFLPVYLFRVRLEEQMMVEYFGETYRSYMKETGRVIPRLIT